jgi:hypothetical protein
MGQDIFTFTLVTVFVPPSLLTVVRTEQAWFHTGLVIDNTTAVLATRSICFRFFRHHPIPSAKGFDRIYRQAQLF